MKNSPYGKSILFHIGSNQIEEGNRYYDFEAITPEGEKFALSSLEGKDILLLYGAQAQPTCFFINKQGMVKMKTVGLDEERVNELVMRQ